MDWINLFDKENSRDVRISKKMFISIMDAIDDGVFITDGIGQILFANDAYLMLTDLERNDLIDHSIQELVNGGVLSRSVSLEVIKSCKKTTILQSLKNSKELLVTGHPVFHETTNSLIAVITSVRDITALLRRVAIQRIFFTIGASILVPRESNFSCIPRPVAPNLVSNDSIWVV